MLISIQLSFYIFNEITCYICYIPISPQCVFGVELRNELKNAARANERRIENWVFANCVLITGKTSVMIWLVKDIAVRDLFRKMRRFKQQLSEKEE